MPIPLVVLAGPTASGKTALAIELCRRFDGEVVSADSMQVYEELHIGTARPTPEEMEGIPHHLMGFLPLGTAYSVAKYAADAHAAIADIAKRGKLPVLCGGTGLYIQAVTENLTYEDQPEDRTLREALRRRAETEGGATLLAELAAVDPETAARLHPNDVGRIVRALELYHTTGLTLTEQNKRSRRNPSPYRVCALYLDYHDRQTLYDRIDRRAALMVEAGVLEEAKHLREHSGAETVAQAIGYKEWYPYLDGRCSYDEALDELRRATRRYAKRQLSWFRNRGGFVPLFMDGEDNAVESAAEAVSMFLQQK